MRARPTLTPLPLLLGAALLAACSHEWDAYDPRLGGGPGAGGGGTGGGPGTGGGGTGGGPGAGGGGGGQGGAGPAPGTVLWARALGDGDPLAADPAVAVDASGNVLVSGSFSGTLSLGGVPLLTSLGGRDAFVIQLGPEGDLRWAAQFGGAGDQIPRGVAADTGGGAIVVGEYDGEVTFGDTTIASAASRDTFLARLNGAGNPLCASSYGGDGDQMGTFVTALPGGEAMITGTFFSSIDFGLGPHAAAGGRDVFAARVGALCDVTWSGAYGGLGSDFSWTVAADAAGDFFLGVDSDAPIDFGGGPLIPGGTDDLFLPKLGPAGEHRWSFVYGDTAPQWAARVATDAAGNLLASGQYQGKITSGGATIESAGDWDVYALKLSADGEPVWAKSFGGPLPQIAVGAATDPAGGTIITGGMQGEVDFGGGPLTSGGAMDVFVLKLDASGNHVWSVRAGDDLAQLGTGAATDSAGHVLVTGRFAGTLQLGDLPEPLTSTSGEDVFVAKLAP